MKRIGPRTESWGTLQVRGEGEDFTSFSYYFCPILQVRKEKGKDHKYQKRFRGESAGCYDRYCRRQRVDPENQNGDRARI